MNLNTATLEAPRKARNLGLDLVEKLTTNIRLGQLPAGTKLPSEAEIMKEFWESHDPTQGMRQGNDIGTTYRSGIYFYSEAQRVAAETSRDLFQKRLLASGYGTITTEIIPAPIFYFAEEYHQQYLAKNPNGYCGLGGTGVSCPIGVSLAAE